MSSIVIFITSPISYLLLALGSPAVDQDTAHIHRLAGVDHILHAVEVLVRNRLDVGNSPVLGTPYFNTTSSSNSTLRSSLATTFDNSGNAVFNCSKQFSIFSGN